MGQLLKTHIYPIHQPTSKITNFQEIIHIGPMKNLHYCCSQNNYNFVLDRMAWSKSHSPKQKAECNTSIESETTKMW